MRQIAKLVRCKTRSELRRICKVLLKDGWKYYGDPFLDGYEIHQWMFKRG